MRRGLVAGATVVAVLVAVVATAALVLPDASSDPRLVPAPPSEEPPVEHAVADRCRGSRPHPAPPGIQTSAPRSAVRPGIRADLGLRDRAATGNRPVAAEVTSPGDRTAAAETELMGDGWAYLRYPDDFGGSAGTHRAGTYRVRWRDGAGATLACDGFVVGARP